MEDPTEVSVIDTIFEVPAGKLFPWETNSFHLLDE